MNAARASGIQNVVQIIDWDLDANPPWFSMVQCAGDLDDVLSFTKNDPTEIARAIIPIAMALDRLSKCQTPIFHRDIKPSNILVSSLVPGFEFVLADFGCAFISDPSLGRVTEDFRAVGATFFRAPEYTHGRVESVSEAADIFALGKVLWYLCNGVSGEVFPYTLWFPEEYNQRNRCTNRLVPRLNSLIAQCVRISPAERINYAGLIHELQEIMNDRLENVSSLGLNASRMQELEAKLSLEQEESKSTLEQLLAVAQNDLRRLAEEFKQTLINTSLAATVDSIWNFGDLKTLAKIVVVDKSDYPVANWNTTHFRTHLHVYPQFMATAHQLNACTGPYLLMSVKRDYNSKGLDCFLYPTREGIYSIVRPGREPAPYSQSFYASVIVPFVNELLS